MINCREMIKGLSAITSSIGMAGLSNTLSLSALVVTAPVYTGQLTREKSCFLLDQENPYKEIKMLQMRTCEL